MFTFIITVLISYGAYHLIKFTFDKKFEEKKTSKYSAWIAFVLFLVIYYGSAYYGFKKPGIVFERAEYETIVNLKVKKGNSIRILQGKIYRGTATTMRGDTYSYYHLLYIQFPSGEKRYFTKGLVSDRRLELESFAVVTDNYEKEWNVKLIPFLPFYLWKNR